MWRFAVFSLFFFLLEFDLSLAQTDSSKNYIPLVTNLSIKRINLEPGKRDLSLKLGNNDEWLVRISMPEKINAATKLVLGLHWYGPIGDHKVFADCLAFPALENKNAIVIAPASENGQWTSPEMEKQLYYLIKRLCKHLSISSSNVYLLGYSNGAIGIWNLAEKHPELFNQGIAISGMYNSQKVDIPFIWIHGTKDELFYIDKIRQMHSGSRSKGSKIELVEIQSKGHYDACSYVEELSELISKHWFD